MGTTAIKNRPWSKLVVEHLPEKFPGGVEPGGTLAGRAVSRACRGCAGVAGELNGGHGRLFGRGLIQLEQIHLCYSFGHTHTDVLSCVPGSIIST